MKCTCSSKAAMLDMPVRLGVVRVIDMGVHCKVSTPLGLSCCVVNMCWCLRLTRLSAWFRKRGYEIFPQPSGCIIDCRFRVQERASQPNGNTRSLEPCEGKRWESVVSLHSIPRIHCKEAVSDPVDTVGRVDLA